MFRKGYTVEVGLGSWVLGLWNLVSSPLFVSVPYSYCPNSVVESLFVAEESKDQRPKTKDLLFLAEQSKDQRPKTKDLL